MYSCPVCEDHRRKYVYNLREFNRVDKLFSECDSWATCKRNIAMFLYHVFKRRRQAADVVQADDLYQHCTL